MAPVKEKLIRGNKFQKAFFEWKDSDREIEVLDRLKMQYQDTKAGSQADLFHIHKSPQANGFFFDDRIGISPQEFSFLLDSFKHRTAAMGYSLYSSERHSIEKSETVQVIERHYLKPEIDRSFNPPIDQRYGNVLLEYVAYNHKPAYLKVMVTSYSDRNYKEALDFRKFIERLFGQN